MDDEISDNNATATNTTATASVDAGDTAAAPAAPANATAAAAAAAAGAGADAALPSTESCHDSGIDIRDPLPTIIPTKKNYSDADIVLSSDWVPPQTIAPTVYTETLSVAALSAQHGAQSHNLEAGGRKKTSSVSFSVDDASESSSGGMAHHGSTSSDKSADKKNKMLKRLSYPLTWVEGFTADGKPGASDSVDSAPNTGDSGQSVFSKVFSR